MRISLSQTVIWQKKEIERLREALDIYGEHRVGCKFIVYANSIRAKCTCGFEQALKEVE